MQDFGSLRRIPADKLWDGEAKEFTAWLAEHLDVLASVLDLELEAVGTEESAGDFSLDMLARVVGDGRPVVIENQLHQTDHDHLAAR